MIGHNNTNFVVFKRLCLALHVFGILFVFLALRPFFSELIFYELFLFIRTMYPAPNFTRLNNLNFTLTLIRLTGRSAPAGSGTNPGAVRHSFYIPFVCLYILHLF